ncbi:GPI mannosyltransferase 4 isoform X2 [Pyxicephalus adspersus]|uniref:GPI mannosyltransferase 4 isoform X2 n=1 Tax=Pyxicephalus adspersus TaxID=30357 RepID=UPI003B5B548E
MENWMLWGALSLLRVIWCLAPQKGYLHPDEFFQSPEVMAGDILDLDTNRPWEFLPVFPCRTVLIPLLTSGTAFWIVGILHQMGLQTVFNYSYILLVLPRLFITVLSFLLDYTVYRVASVCALNPWKALLLLSASHVTLVFYTRTISNAIEGALFFGCLHQAGIIPSLFHIQNILQCTSSSGNLSHHHTILFTHTYMPPHYLLNLRKGQTSVDIIDLAGFDKDKLCQELQAIQEDLTHRNTQLLEAISHDFIVVLPGTLIPVIDNCDLTYKSDTWFSPHLSMEDPPTLSHLLQGNLLSYLALHVIEVEVPTAR